MEQTLTAELIPIKQSDRILSLDVLRGNCMFIFTRVGFGLIGKLQRYELLYVLVGIWIFQLILSPIWLRYFHYGPMEWLWRNLSYRKVHPMRKGPH